LLEPTTESSDGNSVTTSVDGPTTGVDQTNHTPSLRPRLPMDLIGPQAVQGADDVRGRRVIAVINQKGGVGKTTSVVNIGAALARMGQRVLLIDLDPQGHLSLHLGLNPDELEQTTYHLLTRDETTAAQIVRPITENLAVLPAEVNLAGAESELAPKMLTGRAQQILKEKCAPLISGEPGTAAPGDTPATTPGPGFDYVLIDCPPSLGLLTISALVMASEVLVPMQAHFLALQGLSKLFETVSLVRQSFNPKLSVSGIVLCMFEGQTVLAGEVLADLTTFLDSQRDLEVPWRHAQVLRPGVRRNIKLAECPSFGQSIFDYESACRGAQDYQALAEALLAQPVHNYT
jgi:chromosome partitioning protein